MKLSDFVANKFFYSRATIAGNFETQSSAPLPFSIDRLKDNPTANRCFSMIVDSSASINYKVLTSSKMAGSHSQLQPKKIEELLNRQPNPYMDSNFFLRSLVMDLLTDGNAFILDLNNQLYYLPAVDVKVIGDKNILVKGYKFGNDTFEPNQVLHIKDNSSTSILRGETRLKALRDIVDLHKKMKDFQKNFFNNNAMPGVILSSPNTLTEKLKKRKLQEWAQDFNPTSGARRPAFLDGGITISNLETSTFKEMDFENSIQGLERDIAKGMGVPPILLDGGNNANITPNHRLFYLETILPICTKIAKVLSLHFGYQIVPIEVGVPALQPDLRDLANYVSTLVNGGVMYPNEGRDAVGLPVDTSAEANQLRIPANVAGSAADPSQGGRPSDDKDKK